MSTVKKSRISQNGQRDLLQRRRVLRMYSYGPWQRLVDVAQARAAARTSPCVEVGDTPLFRRLRWTYEEAADNAFVRGQAINHEAIRRLEENVRLLDDARAEIMRRQAAADAAVPADLSLRRGGEKHLAEHAIAARREREATAARAQLISAVDLAQDRVTALMRACRVDSSDLREQFELVVAFDFKLRAHALRRAANYGRAFDAHREAPSPTAEIPGPPWAERPCPWIPSEYHKLTSGSSDPDCPPDAAHDLTAGHPIN